MNFWNALNLWVKICHYYFWSYHWETSGWYIDDSGNYLERRKRRIFYGWGNGESSVSTEYILWYTSTTHSLESLYVMLLLKFCVILIKQIYTVGEKYIIQASMPMGIAELSPVIVMDISNYLR